MTQSSFRAQQRFTPSAACVKSPVLGLHEGTPLLASVASDCLARPQDEESRSPITPPPLCPLHPLVKLLTRGFQGTATHLPVSLAGIDSSATISTINCCAEYVSLLPRVPTDPEAFSRPVPLPPTHVYTLSTKVPKTLVAWTKLTHLSNQPIREGCCSFPWALKLTWFIMSSEF